MPKLSRYSFQEERVRELIGQLWSAFTLLEDKQEVKRFFSKFFTPAEIEMLAKRVELLKLADSDLEVPDLIRFTGLSRATVYEWLEKHDAFEDDYHIVIDRLKELDREYLKKLKKQIAAAGLPQLSYKASVGKDLLNLGGAVYQGYKKRKKRKSVLE